MQGQIVNLYTGAQYLLVQSKSFESGRNYTAFFTHLHRYKITS